MPTNTIPDIPARMGEAGAYQEQLYPILTAMKTKIDGKVAANQAASTASDVAGVVTDLNALLTKLKAAGLMTADA